MIRVQSFLLHIYSKEAVEKIQKELNHYLKTLPKKHFSHENTDWYKSTNLYVVYPDAVEGQKATPLRNLENFLPHIYETGFHAVHILPFLDSPMIDRGFDVRDFYKIRADLGDMHDLDKFKETADKLQLKIFMDLVFNHVSNAHEWFVKAQQGEEKYRNYFIHTKEKPQFIGTFQKDTAVWARYKNRGKEIVTLVEFPDFSGPIPHWVQGTDGYWYYHTYKPQQVDIDWRNPDVFIECAKIMIFWAQKGYNFRLDAIPFVGKNPYKKINIRTNFTNHLLASLNHIAKQINPQCVFILETYEHISTQLQYLGKKNLEQAELLYGFHLATALWVCLVERDSLAVWNILHKIAKIPTFAQWVNFLRNHDELSLAYLDTQTLSRVKTVLLQNGKRFREGFGVSGRTMSLLGNDKNHFLMAYFLLFSMPGGILMPYGDEFGKVNTPENQLSEKEKTDTRSINRGTLTEEFLRKHREDHIWTAIMQMLLARHSVRPYFNAWPRKKELSNSLFAAEYGLDGTKLHVIINLTNISVRLPNSYKNHKKIYAVNDVVLEDGVLALGPYAGIWMQE